MLALVVLAIVAFAALAWRPAIDPVAPPARTSFDAALIQRGAVLANAGNCTGCHTVAGGLPFAGGLALATPFGTLYSTNITPDRDTGIGRWSFEAFERAMRRGVDRAGSHLYPAFPYTHYTRLTDDDVRALYAYVMTRTPVRAEAPANQLAFPLGFRPLLAGWKLLFFREERFQADASQAAEWNRGAYLAESLGHCSACHSPRNALGAERRGEHLGGGDAEGWHSPALNANSPSPLPWTVDALATYLRTGIAADHAIAGGPMQGVVRSLQQIPADDVRAIATYIHARMGPAAEPRQARATASVERARQAPFAVTGIGTGASAPAPAASGPGDDALLQLGARVYADACASCHAMGRELSSGSGLQLPLAIALYEPTPASLIRIVREGIAPGEGERGRWMPSFAGALTDEQIAALAQYLRRAGAGAPAWPDVAGEVRKARHP
ncbi:c-type cytochrome [Piscinibacter koreensis]|uniref:c-type cytochrome n=1 Tax=Piscinibacter koreensis TaxID=2742824 RepID=UPI001C376BF8